MVGQRNKLHENPMPVTDEGWWASVLAEEGRNLPPPARVQKQEPKAEEPPRQVADWAQVKDLYSRDQIVNLRVSGHNRGGLLVEGEGMYGFVPFSHLIELAGKPDLIDRENSLEAYLGRSLNLKVIECVPEDGRIVFSERAALAEPGQRTVLFNAIQPGQHITGLVTNITDFGVFVDLGGVEGLIHISELSWGRVIHPNQVVHLNQKVEVMVLELAPERCRVALSLKRLAPNPWEKAHSLFAVGSILPAVITSVVSYGAFARLEAGVEGLIHASEIPLEPGQPVKEALTEGQSVTVRVLHVDAAQQRMGLSLKID
jgi:small subunit ribosomal protein S1